MKQDLNITNIGTWLHDLDEDTIFRFRTYKRIFTPYEQEKKYLDETRFEEGTFYSYGKILNIIEIPGDLLLEIREVYQKEEGGPFEDYGSTVYRRLSDIQLEKRDKDNISVEELAYEE